MPASMMQLSLDGVTGLTGVRAGAQQRWQNTGWPDQRAEQWREHGLHAERKSCQQSRAGAEDSDVLPARRRQAQLLCDVRLSL